jgi:hypothetical protein
MSEILSDDDLARIDLDTEPLPRGTWAVTWQYRTRPTWDERHPWTEWTRVTAAAAAEYLATPVLHDWQYEVRALYAHPAPTDPTTESVEWLLARCEEYQRRAHEAEIEVMRLRAQIEQIGGGR